MDPGNLIEWLREFQSAETLEERIEWAGKIADEVRPKLEWFVVSRFSGSGKETPEDVLQDILVAIAEGLDGCQAETDREFWGFCYRIARNQLVNRFRKRGIELIEVMDSEAFNRLLESEAAVDPPSEGERHDLEYALALLGSAKPPCREILYMHYILDLDYETIAETLGIQREAVRMRIKRCLELARELLEKHG